MVSSDSPEAVILICRFPPTIGGNSVHAQRLLKLLVTAGIDAQGVDYAAGDTPPSDPNVVPLRGNAIVRLRNLARLIRRSPLTSLVHFHVSALGNFKWAFLPLLWASRYRKRVITIHSGNFVAAMDHALGRTYLRWLFRHFHRVIVVSEAQAQFARSQGVEANRIAVIPAYLPEEGRAAEAPAEVLAARKGRQIVVTSGYLLPLYNYEVLIGAMRELPASQYLFVFAFYNDSEPDYASKILSALHGFPNVVILRDRSPESFLNLLAAADIYVRTTVMDGDAVAIREALHHGKRVFATDSVSRPPGCEIFSCDDAGSLLRLFAGTASGEKPAEIESPFERILSVYRDAASEGRAAGGQRAPVTA